MLLLVTIGLVVVAAAALLVGFVNNQLGPIYVSIVCSALAGLVLVLFSRLSRRHAPAIASAGGPTPLSSLGAAFQSRPAAPRAAAPPLTPTFGTSRPASPPPPPAPAADEEQAGWADEPWFPIEDSDDMRVAEILPLLPELDLDELDRLREHEAEGKARASVLIRIDELIADLEEVSAGAAPEEDARAQAEDVTPTPAASPSTPIKRAPAVENWGPEVERVAPAKVAAATAIAVVSKKTAPPLEVPPTQDPEPTPAKNAVAAKVELAVEPGEPPASAGPMPPVPPVSAVPPVSPGPPLAAAPGPPKPRLAMKAAASAIKKPPPVKKAVTKQAPAAKRR